MADITNLHPDKNYAVVLTGPQWLALMLRLAKRDHDIEQADIAEATILQQLGEYR